MEKDQWVTPTQLSLELPYRSDYLQTKWEMVKTTIPARVGCFIGEREAVAARWAASVDFLVAISDHSKGKLLQMRIQTFPRQ
jgi:hypothetical protein